MSIFLAAMLAASCLTWAVLVACRRYGAYDVPNSRSSHSRPTPRGGGVSIVAVFLATVLVLTLQGAIPGGLGRALIGGGVAVAVAGFCGDRNRLTALPRLVIHFAAAGWSVWQLHGIGPLYLGWLTLDWVWLNRALALIGLVWMINLYNFMDGIDGLAGMEAAFAGGAGSLLTICGGQGGTATAASALAGAAIGFLLWNWAPAKIFMGDIGSGFLGFVFGFLALSAAKAEPSLLWPWLILLSVFIADSAVTLLRRLIGGARWYEAHCSHAYQHAARRWGSHSKVTLTVAAINLVWLFPLAWAACGWPRSGPLLFVVAIAPLAYAAFRHHAGRVISRTGRPYSQPEAGRVAAYWT